MIGRRQEKQYLLEMAEREEAQLVAVYGRRRVGKTYLVRQTFGKRILFEHTGLYQVGLPGQLQAFRDSLARAGAREVPRLRTWREAFVELERFISLHRRGTRILFFDELPWMDTPKSDFIAAFEHFWNGWASAQTRLLLVFCGSATSWIIRKVMKNKGGLHNRITGQIALAPFTLAECQEYAASQGLVYSERDIAEGYMVMGGVPYYWSLLRRRESLAQGIDRLFFAPNGPLRHEFSELFDSLFNGGECYLGIVNALARRAQGMSLAELSAALRKEKGGGLSRQLEELEQCGFVRRTNSWGRRRRDVCIRLIDNFTLFHFAFLAGESNPDAEFWSKSMSSGAVLAWKGLAFERICLQHIPQIKRALGISGVLTKVYAWRHRPDDVHPQGAQIDLLIERADRIVNVCEMKWTDGEFAIDKDYDAKLRGKLAVFRAVTGTRMALHLTMVTADGLAHNKYWNGVQSEVQLHQLFAEP